MPDSKIDQRQWESVSLRKKSWKDRLSNCERELDKKI